MKHPCVYLLSNQRNGTLYAGVTSDLIARTWQHREHLVDGFAGRYGIDRLVWYELHDTMESAILREKRIKKWNREWKVAMIERENPTWRDLWGEICGIESVDSRLRGNDEFRLTPRPMDSRLRGNDELDSRLRGTDAL